MLTRITRLAPFGRSQRYIVPTRNVILRPRFYCESAPETPKIAALAPGQIGENAPMTPNVQSVLAEIQQLERKEVLGLVVSLQQLLGFTDDQLGFTRDQEPWPGKS